MWQMLVTKMPTSPWTFWYDRWHLYFARLSTPIFLFRNSWRKYIILLSFISPNSSICVCISSYMKFIWFWKLFNFSKLSLIFTWGNMFFQVVHSIVHWLLMSFTWWIFTSWSYICKNIIITKTLAICDMHAKWRIRKDAWTEFCLRSEWGQGLWFYFELWH